jgi:hypothetical protein
METATNFSAIEAIVHQGKAVVSSEDSAIIEWTITDGRTATLYLKPSVDLKLSLHPHQGTRAEI